MNKRKQRKAVKSGIICPIESVQKLGQQCGKVLASALDVERVIHSEIIRPHAASSLQFHGVPNISAEINGENRPVILVKGTVDRWLHVTIDLRSTDGHWHLRHISIGLLGGDLAARKRPILRAEWMINEAEHGPGHAQPHWYVLDAVNDHEQQETFDVLMSASAQGFDKFLGKGEVEPAEESASSIFDGFSHFHYAMVSDWHCTPSSGVSRNLDNEAELLSWLNGCVKYIRHQLEHVDRKARWR